ncbi:MAG: hypothetical protein FWC43_12155, partial [Planctomycetaceae bacterium]|nr:hypothetical protein [Planctomycetaceae bacterium]
SRFSRKTVSGGACPALRQTSTDQSMLPFPKTPIIFPAFRGAPWRGLAIGVVWLVLSGLSVLSAAELQQQWVDDTAQNGISAEPLFPTIPVREEINIDSGDDADMDYYLAQRGLLSRSEASIRQGMNRLQTIISPEEAGRTNSNVRAIYFEWFDSRRARSVPVKIYYPANAYESCPTILFSHGLGGANENCAYLGEYWAYNGYVAVFIHHFGSDDSVWKGKVRPLNELRNAYESSWTGRSRVQDVQFVLAQLEKYDGQQANSPLRLIDKKRIGVAGYDLGALASLVMVGQRAPEGYTLLQNPQIKAVLAMSPPIVNSGPFPAVYGQIETPCLFITGTKDDGIIGTTQAPQRRIPFDSISCNDQYLVTFDGTDHMLYAGHLLSIVQRTRNDEPYQNAIARLSTNFWNAYLKEDPKALEFMMSRNIMGLLGGLGQIERKFYLRERRDVSSEEQYSERKETPAFTAPAEAQETRETPQYLAVPRSPYSESYSPTPRQLRSAGSLTPRRLPGRLP